VVDGHEWFWPTLPHWETKTFDVLNRFADKEKDFIDIGAWNGVVSLPASKLFRQVLAIEPDYMAFNILKRNIQINSIENAMLWQMVVSDFEGRTEFYGNTGDSMSSALKRDEHLEPTEVRCITLERILKEYFAGQIGLIKMDIEGGESLVLPHSIEILRKLKPPMYVSFHPAWIPEFDNFLESIEPLFDFYTCEDLNGQKFSFAGFCAQVNAGNHSFLFYP
jgi:FkbM family methyltransferase